MPAKTRFTIYDAMEQNGFFSSNPANPGSRDTDGNPLYSGPQEYPKMLYHPEGEERVVVPAEMVLQAGQYVPVNEQKQLIDKTVANREEEDALRAEGWLDHPAKAMEIRIRKRIAEADLSEAQAKKLLASIPKIAISVNREAELLAEIARLKALKADDEEAA